MTERFVCEHRDQKCVLVLFAELHHEFRIAPSALCSLPFDPSIAPKYMTQCAGSARQASRAPEAEAVGLASQTSETSPHSAISLRPFLAGKVEEEEADAAGRSKDHR